MMKVLFCALFIASTVWSTDSASFRYLGASRGRTHAAWMSSGVQAESGFPWSMVELFTTSPFRVLERHTVLISDASSHEETAADSALALAEGSLERFGIFSQYGGQVLLDHKITDAGVSPDTVVFCMEPHYTWYPALTYTMILEQIPSGAGGRTSDWLPEPVLPRLIMTDGRSRALVYRETEAPEEYSQSFAYRISKIIRLNGDILIVVLNVMEPGSEGPDLRFRVLAVDFPIAWRN